MLKNPARRHQRGCTLSQETSNLCPKFSENFDATPLKASDATLKTTIYFVVETDGTVNRIKAVGDNPEFNAEAERTLSSIKTKYQPATVNNLSVRYLLRFPLSMNIK